MGIDMFLEKETSFFNNKLELKVDGEWIDTSRLTKIIQSVAYWKDFYVMHEWIVEHIQEGIDDRLKYWIDEESMLDLCDYLVSRKGESEELDERIEKAVDTLTILLGDHNITEFSAFYYQST